MKREHREFYWKSLLEAATGATVFGGMEALQEVVSRMELARGQLPADIVINDYPPCLKILNSHIQRLRKSPPPMHAAIAHAALMNASVKKVIGKLARRGFDDGAKYLFTADKNIARRYDGDAAKKLIEQIAFFLAEEFPQIGAELGGGIFWLSRQSIVRDTFGPKDADGKPLHGRRLAMTMSTTQRHANLYVQYLKERRLLYIAKEQLLRSHLLSPYQAKVADRLWRNQQAQFGTKRGTIRKWLSDWKRAYEKLGMGSKKALRTQISS